MLRITENSRIIMCYLLDLNGLFTNETNEWNIFF